LKKGGKGYQQPLKQALIWTVEKPNLLKNEKVTNIFTELTRGEVRK